MAQHKKPSQRPQPRHKKSQPSQHDKRQRLDRPNPDRRHTTRAKIPLIGGLAAAVGAMAAALDRRLAFRLAIIVAGMLLADDRRTASAWFAAGGVLDDWDRFYDALIAIGRKSQELSAVVLRQVVAKLDPGPGGSSYHTTLASIAVPSAVLALLSIWTLVDGPLMFAWACHVRGTVVRSRFSLASFKEGSRCRCR